MSTENSDESGRGGDPAARAGADLDLSDAMVDAVIAHLEDRDPREPSMWVGMVFMECTLGDIAPYRGDLQYRLNSSDSPVNRPDGLSDEQLRTVTLALRRRARKINGQQPLTPEQEADWRFEAPTYPPRKRKSKGGEAIDEWVVPTPDEERQAIEYLNSKYPDVVNYWRDVVRHNDKLSRDEYSSIGVKGGYFRSRLDEALDQVREIESHQFWDTLAVHDIANRIGSKEL